jgi:thiol-disulfide isomerase/thioredoxin
MTSWKWWIPLCAVLLLSWSSFAAAAAGSTRADGEVDLDDDYYEDLISGVKDKLSAISSDNSNPKISQSSSSPTNVFESMFGNTLYKWGAVSENDATSSYPKDSPIVFEEPTKDLLAKKSVVAVYFSASWCPPCRQFTPLLVKLYNAVNKKRPGALEVVWVSGDRSQKDFLDYYGKMPWLAVTLQQMPKVTQHLYSCFHVTGIPHLVLLDGQDGSVLWMDAKRQVAEDPQGLQFPWRSRASALMKLTKPLRQFFLRQVQVAKSRLVALLTQWLRSIFPTAGNIQKQKQQSNRRKLH